MPDSISRSFGHIFLHMGIFIAVLIVPYALVFSAQPPLQMGLLPYLSSERLFEYFLPMKDYLEVKLKRRIVLSTAPDFKTYVQRAARGEYDIYQTAPHFALLAEVEHGYQRVARLTRDLSGDIVVRRDSQVRHIKDLRGRTVITPDALAITSLLGEELLKTHGLEPGRGYRLLRTSSHNNAIMTVYRNQADAAFSSVEVLEKLPLEITRELRILAKTRQVPHMMIMAHRRMQRADYDRLKTALLAFAYDGSGHKFFEATGYGDIGPISDADMARLQPFLTDLKDRLK